MHSGCSLQWYVGLTPPVVGSVQWNGRSDVVPKLTPYLPTSAMYVFVVICSDIYIFQGWVRATCKSSMGHKRNRTGKVEAKVAGVDRPASSSNVRDRCFRGEFLGDHPDRKPLPPTGQYGCNEGGVLCELVPSSRAPQSQYVATSAALGEPLSVGHTPPYQPY